MELVTEEILQVVLEVHEVELVTQVVQVLQALDNKDRHLILEERLRDTEILAAAVEIPLAVEAVQVKAPQVELVEDKVLV